jgi:hypothetical protein
MEKLLLTILIATFGSLLLHIFYRIIESRWPDNYFTTTQLVEYTVSRNWLRYTAFRIAPPYAIAVLIGTLCIRAQVNISPTLILCATIHLLNTSIRAVVTSWLNKMLRIRLFVANLASIAFVAFAFSAAGYTARWWLPYVPGPDKYIEVLATGGVAAALIFYLQKFTSGEVDLDLVIRRYFAWLPTHLAIHIDRTCAKYRVDHDLVTAIVITEWAQRPAWIRQVERLSPFGIAKTHGLMQAAQRRGASDEESIEAGVRNLAGSIIPRHFSTFGQDSLIEFYLEKHNKGIDFIQFASSVLQKNPNGYYNQTEYVAKDGRPGIRSKTPRRVGDNWTITGDVCLEVTLEIQSDDPRTLEWNLIENTNGTRRTWEARCSIHTKSLQIYGYGSLPTRPNEGTKCTYQIQLS